MRSFVNRILLFCCFIVCTIEASAQLPVCPPTGNGLIYYIHSDTILNYDPSLPISSTNPIANTILLPTGANGLAVSNNLNTSSPATTFYTVVSGNYYYYNGTSWVNTGHLAAAMNIGAGGGYIYSLDPSGALYQYNGTANASFLTTISFFSGVADVVADCAGNFYLLNTGSTNSLKEYNSAGSLLKTWSINGAISSGGAGLAILGNNVYYGSTAVYKGLVSANSISSSLFVSLGSSPNDFATCPIGGLHHSRTNVHNVTYCLGAPAIQVSANGSGPFNWSVISGPAVISGSGSSIGITSSGASSIMMSDTSFCGGYMPEDTVNISMGTTPTLTDSSNSPICSGNTLNITSQSNPAVGAVYQWSGPNGFSGSNKDSSVQAVSAAYSGNYYITATVGGCSITDTLSIVINTTPSIPTAGSNSPMCESDSLKLNATDSLAGVNFIWTGPGNYSSSSSNPAIANAVLADSGEYYVSASLSGCSTSDSLYVIIKPRPAVPMNSSNSPLCSGDSLFLNSNCTTNNVVYNWTGPNGFYSAAPQLGIGNVGLSDSGYYTASAVLNGCTAKDSVHVVVNPKPIIQFANNNSPLCTGGTLTLSTITNIGGVTYYWSGPNNFIDSAQNPVLNNVLLADTGKYIVYAKSAACTSATDSTYVVLYPTVAASVSILSIPNPVVPGIPAQFFAYVVNGGSAPIFQWRRNGVDIPGYVINPSYITLSDTDVITVWIHGNANCASPDTAISNPIHLPGADVLSNNMRNAIRVFPNPARDVVYVDATIKVHVKIFSSDGREVSGEYIDTKQIDISRLAIGNYSFNFYDENGSLIRSEKLLKIQ